MHKGLTLTIAYVVSLTIQNLILLNLYSLTISSKWTISLQLWCCWNYCIPNQNYQHFFWKIIQASSSKLSEKLKNVIKTLVGQAVPELLINKSRTAWSTKIWMPVLSFSDNLLIYQNIFDKFEIAHKTCSNLVWGEFPP